MVFERVNDCNAHEQETASQSVDYVEVIEKSRDFFYDQDSVNVDGNHGVEIETDSYEEGEGEALESDQLGDDERDYDRMTVIVCE